MGNLELPGAATGSKQMIKVPIGTYEFGANLISEKGVSVAHCSCQYTSTGMVTLLVSVCFSRSAGSKQSYESAAHKAQYISKHCSVGHYDSRL